MHPKVSNLLTAFWINAQCCGPYLYSSSETGYVLNLSLTSCTSHIPLLMHSMGSLVGNTSLWLRGNEASLFYKVTYLMSSKCLAAPSGNLSLAYFDSNKYSVSEPMYSISFRFNYILASTFCIVAGKTMLPMHIFRCSTLCYTIVVRCSVIGYI